MRSLRHPAILGVIVLSLGLGAYFGSSQVATRASTGRATRAVYLRSQDVAIFGGVQCIANTEAGARHLLCQRRPRAKTRYEVAIYPDSIIVYRMGQPDNPVYATPRK